MPLRATHTAHAYPQSQLLHSQTKGMGIVGVGKFSQEAFCSVIVIVCKLGENQTQEMSLVLWKVKNC